jgi:hypothetical protein
MDDRFSEYIIAVGQVCAAAELARFQLEVVTGDGQVVAGLVNAPRTADGEVELDQTGLQRTVQIADTLVNLDEIVRCTMLVPEVAGAPW